MKSPPHKPEPLRALLLLSAVLAAAYPAPAQQTQQNQEPKALVAAAVQSELHANQTDHTAFMYRDHDVTPDHDTVFFVVETPAGNLKRKLLDHDRPLTPEDRRADDAALHTLLNNPGQMQKLRQNNAHDDEQAEAMLKLLPVAYIWTIASEHGDLTTLNFRPDPAFTPSSLEARVLAGMAGQIVVARSQNRIATIRGSLVDDVKFGYGLLGRLRKGGSFQVERREVAPHHWQISESHVHIAGHALFFKSIGDQEDEVKFGLPPLTRRDSPTGLHPPPGEPLENPHDRHPHRQMALGRALLQNPRTGREGL